MAAQVGDLPVFFSAWHSALMWNNQSKLRLDRQAGGRLVYGGSLSLSKHFLLEKGG